MFDSSLSAPPLDEAALQAALDELTERWRAEARAEEQACFQATATALADSFEAGATHLAEVRAAQAMIGAQEARRARAVAAFCRSRPASLDRPDSEVGAAAAATRAARPSSLAAVSEWAVDEVALALSLTESSATRIAVQSLQLVDRLPGTLDALEQGALTWEHARVMTELVAPLDDAVRAQAEARLLSRLGSKTPAQLRAAAHRVVARLDAQVIARRVREAIRDRRISVYPGPDGMSTLASTLTTPVARAIEDALGQYADAAATPGDERTRAQRMVDCLVDLVLRPGEHMLAPVQAQLTVVATVETLLGTDDEPGEVNGDLVPAETVRRLAESLGLLPPADTPPADTPPADTP
ncbi:MAG: putative endonuclease, partial [Modestobacter sp.]|nr:putative endonuclease [Modestobacter sp.]